MQVDAARRPRRRRRTSGGPWTSITRHCTGRLWATAANSQPQPDAEPAGACRRGCAAARRGEPAGVVDEDRRRPPAPSRGGRRTCAGRRSRSASTRADCPAAAAPPRRRRGPRRRSTGSQRLDQGRLVHGAAAAHVDEHARRPASPRRRRRRTPGGLGRERHRVEHVVGGGERPRAGARSARSGRASGSHASVRPTAATSMPERHARFRAAARPIGPGRDHERASRRAARVSRWSQRASRCRSTGSSARSRREREQHADDPLRDRLVEDPAGVRHDDVALHERREEQAVDARRGRLDPAHAPGGGPRCGQLRALVVPEVDGVGVGAGRGELDPAAYRSRMSPSAASMPGGGSSAVAEHDDERHLGQSGRRPMKPESCSCQNATSSSPRRQQRKTMRPSRSAGKSTSPVSGSRSRMSRSARTVTSSRSVCWRQPVAPATPPAVGGDGVGDPLAGLDQARRRDARIRASCSRSSGSSAVRLLGRVASLTPPPGRRRAR